MRPYYRGSEDVLLCPMANKLPDLSTVPAPGPMTLGPVTLGGKSFAWGMVQCWGLPNDFYIYSSYGHNLCVGDAAGFVGLPEDEWRRERKYVNEWLWTPPFAKGQARTPLLMDCSDYCTTINEHSPPPGSDAPPKFRDDAFGRPASTDICMNRHYGAINCLFLDWSVRKVGLKEFWTLRWSKNFDTAGPWTKAGGVKPEDWPKWMRHFKDY